MWEGGATVGRARADEGERACVRSAAKTWGGGGGGAPNHYPTPPPPPPPNLFRSPLPSPLLSLFPQIPATRPKENSNKRMSKKNKTVHRAYGGHLAHSVVRERVVRAFLVEEQVSRRGGRMERREPARWGGCLSIQASERGERARALTHAHHLSPPPPPLPLQKIVKRVLKLQSAKADK